MEIMTDCGQVRGVETEACFVYRGIPYAQPPVGELRWRAPRPCTPWEGVLGADHFAGRSLHTPAPPDSFYGKEFSSEQESATPLTEDCLYLNIWTPKDSLGKKLPVAVWIHGGAFLTGCGHKAQFDGTVYAKKDVILVTINYRLGVWGFLAHPWFSGEDVHGSSGNYGILDQIAALQWVQRNIAAFGGDPENVTVFGQSAGAISTLILSGSPLTKGLFARAIIQSGMGLHKDYPLEAAMANGEEFAANAGVHSVEELRALPAEKITEAAGPLIRKGFSAGGQLAFQPNRDGWVMTDTYAALQQGGVRDIPYIVGSNKNDMLTKEPAPGKEGPMYEAAKAFAANVSGCHSAPVYAYYFTRQLPGDEAGAFHSAELWYTFGTLGRSWRPMEPADFALSEEMVTAWSGFMKTGTPGWPAYTKDDINIRVFDV